MQNNQAYQLSPRNRSEHSQTNNQEEEKDESPAAGSQVEQFFRREFDDSYHQEPILAICERIRPIPTQNQSSERESNPHVHNVEEEEFDPANEEQDGEYQQESENDNEEGLHEEDESSNNEFSGHQVHEILEVKLQPNLDLQMLVGNNLAVFQNSQGQGLGSHFLVSWKCRCCRDNKRSIDQSWLYMAELVNTYEVDHDKLKHLETVAIRELREKETKRHAKELTKYLSFEDIEDFSEAEFEEKNFSQQSLDSRFHDSADESEGTQNCNNNNAIITAGLSSMAEEEDVGRKQSKVVDESLVFSQSNNDVISQIINSQNGKPSQKSNDSWENYATMEYHESQSLSQQLQIEQSNRKVIQANKQLLGKRNEPPTGSPCEIIEEMMISGKKHKS